MDQIIREMAGEAAAQLENCGKESLKAKVKQTVRHFLGKNPLPKDRIFWPAGLLMLGLVQAGDPAPAMRFLGPWMDSGCKVFYPDDAVTGYVLLELMRRGSMTGGNVAGGSTAEVYAKVREAADKIAAFLYSTRKDSADTIVYNPYKPADMIYADGAGQSALFLSAYSALTGDAKAAALARSQLAGFLRSGMDAGSGLPYHGYDLADGIKQGIIGWGRACGWLMMGFSSYVCNVPGDEPMEQAFLSLMEAVLRWQRPDGLLAWQLEAAEGHKDTSATAMVFWSVALAMKHRTRLLEGTGAANCAALAEQGLRACIRDGKVYDASGECIDFSMYPQKYGCYAWGQGTTLAFLSLMREADDTATQK